MNKLKSLKAKTTSPDNGLFSKLTKRYSTVVSSKLIRKSSTSPTSYRSRSPQKHLITGSYDMNGHLSEDHKLEIGAPILISKTNLDVDYLDSHGQSIQNGISSTANSSNESENENFADAISSFPPNVQDIKFEFLSSREKDNSTDSDQTTTSNNTNNTLPCDIPGYYYETPKSKKIYSDIMKNCKNRSKSQQNLHKSELRVFLQKAPSNLELDLKFTTADLDNCFDLPQRNKNSDLDEFVSPSSSPIKCDSPVKNYSTIKYNSPIKYGSSSKYESPSNNSNNKSSTNSPQSLCKSPILYTSPICSKIVPKSKSPQPPPPLPPVDIDDSDLEPIPNQRNLKKLSHSEPNTPLNPEKTDFVVHHFKSVEALNNPSDLKKNYEFASSIAVNNNNKYKGSQDSMGYTSSIDDFDLKSVSLQSLNAKNLFLSIEELNEITKEINESEEFNNEIDLEYCEHRDNLKPNERRITLLKNKNSRLISLDRNKEKLNHAWSGIKNWIGEESGKIKEVVQKHAAMQRVGGAKDNKMKSPPQSGRESMERSNGQASYTSSMMSINRSVSTHTVVGEDVSDAIADDSESVFTLSGGPERNVRKKCKTKEGWEGQNGFEELRRYIKQGGDFGKDLVNILQERIDAEQIYSKSLSKMANKLNKACRDVPGTIADAWRGVATEMESRSEVHRQLSASLQDEIVKPFKAILETHHKNRKTVETNVDKASRILNEWRISEAKAKKSSHTAARENEKLQDAMLDVRIQKSPSIALLQQGSKDKNVAEKEIKSAEKDCAKLDGKRRKAEEAVKRADVEYYTLCIRAERARVDWEMSVLRGSTVLQSLENQRLAAMKTFINSYGKLTADINPVLDQFYQRLAPQIEACNVQKDLAVIKNIRRASEGPSEQLLPDFYCEHTTLAMNRERRKHALIKLLQLVKTDLERERRSRNGLKGLSQTMNNQDNQNITDKLYHIRSMLTYLEGSRFKLHSALLELDHKPRSSHPLAPHIQITRDRTGLQQSILKVPLWLKNNDKMSSSVDDANNILNGSKDNEYIQENGDCIDIKNDELIKNFSRSKSTTELIMNGTQLTELCNKSNTLPVRDSDSPSFDRGIADGGSNQPDSDFDEFSSQDDEDETRKSMDKLNGIGGLTNNIINNNSNNNIGITTNGGTTEQSSNRTSTIILSKCKALYSYTPKLYDELELTPGDIIEVHAKQEDGWWLGALGDQVGIFPATYVEEFV